MRIYRKKERNCLVTQRSRRKEKKRKEKKKLTNEYWQPLKNIMVKKRQNCVYILSLDFTRIYVDA